MTRLDLDKFEKLAGQLEGLYDELSVLSKKSPNDAVSKFKLAFVNDLISQANDFLGSHYLPFGAFRQFDADKLPQNSDVVLILTQYLQCLEKYRADNVVRQIGHWYWAVKPTGKERGDEKGFVYVETTCPKRLRD